MEIKLDIPGELITKDSSEINYAPLQGKTIVGCSGYSTSGKDTLARLMVNRLGFKRISFGDALKQELDEHMKMQVFQDLQNREINLSYENIKFLNPDTQEIKETLRPYMIWFGEEMRRINGSYHWINKAFTQIGDNKKIVITDIRRLDELEIFKSNREFYKRKLDNRKVINIPKGPIEEDVYDCNFETLLIHINQYGLRDKDHLTVETVLRAHEDWMFDDIVFVDSRIPNVGDYRNNHMMLHLNNLVKKFPNYFI